MEGTMNMVFKYVYPGHQWLAMQRVAALPLCLSFGAPLVLLWFPHGDSEISRMEEYAVCNVCSLTNEARYVASRTYFHGRANPCLFSVVSIVLANHFGN